jgi:hypothetical protein
MTGAEQPASANRRHAAFRNPWLYSPPPTIKENDPATACYRSKLPARKSLVTNLARLFKASV